MYLSCPYVFAWNPYPVFTPEDFVHSYSFHAQWSQKTIVFTKPLSISHMIALFPIRRPFDMGMSKLHLSKVHKWIEGHVQFQQWAGRVLIDMSYSSINALSIWWKLNGIYTCNTKLLYLTPAVDYTLNQRSPTPDAGPTTGLRLVWNWAMGEMGKCTHMKLHSYKWWASMFKHFHCLK